MSGPDPFESEIVTPELLPPGPVPQRSAQGPVGSGPVEWGPVLGSALLLDLLGLMARGPMRLFAGIAGAILGVYLLLKLRLPLRRAGWAAAGGAIYASLTHAKFLPIALIGAGFRLWQLRGKR